MRPKAPWAPDADLAVGLHDEPRASGPCRGAGEHDWDRMGDHLWCPACGWVACCARKLHPFARRWAPECPGGAAHAWAPQGIHWRCDRCSLVPCCSANSRRRRMGEARAAVVALLLARDGNRCYYCGALFGEPAFGRMAALTVDHRTPRVMGGTNDPKNLALACAFCNRRKGSRSAEEFEGSEDLVERRRHVLRVTLAGQGYHWRGGYRHEGTFERIGDLWRCSTCGAVGRPGRQSEIFRTPCRPSTTVDDGAPAA